jgi:hypothetical protein
MLKVFSYFMVGVASVMFAATIVGSATILMSS